MKFHICPSYAYFSSSLFIVLSLFGRVQVSIFVFYDWIMDDFMKQFQRPFIEFRIYSKLVPNILRILLCFVYICIYIFALCILFTPWSYTSHRLMFFVVNTTEKKAYFILSILSVQNYICYGGFLLKVPTNKLRIYFLIARCTRYVSSHTTMHFYRYCIDFYLRPVLAFGTVYCGCLRLCVCPFVRPSVCQWRARPRGNWWPVETRITQFGPNFQNT